MRKYKTNRGKFGLQNQYFVFTRRKDQFLRSLNRYSISSIPQSASKVTFEIRFANSLGPCIRVTRGEGGGLPYRFSKVGKNCANFGKKCPDCGRL